MPMSRMRRSFSVSPVSGHLSLTCTAEGYNSFTAKLMRLIVGRCMLTIIGQSTVCRSVVVFRSFILTRITYKPCHPHLKWPVLAIPAHNGLLQASTAFPLDAKLNSNERSMRLLLDFSEKKELIYTESGCGKEERCVRGSNCVRSVVGVPYSLSREPCLRGPWRRTITSQLKKKKN